MVDGGCLEVGCAYMSICFFCERKLADFGQLRGAHFKIFDALLHIFVLKIERLWDKCVEK